LAINILSFNQSYAWPNKHKLTADQKGPYSETAAWQPHTHKHHLISFQQQGRDDWHSDDPKSITSIHNNIEPE
jgi:hypothetical protein